MQNHSPPSETLWHKPLVSGTDNMGERRGNFCLKPWDRMHGLLCLVLQKSQPPPRSWADPLEEKDAVVCGGSHLCRRCQFLPRAAVVLWWYLSSLLDAYSEGRGGAGISALLGSMLIVLAVQDGWQGVCAVPSDRCSQNLCLCVDTVGSVWL